MNILRADSSLHFRFSQLLQCQSNKSFKVALHQIKCQSWRCTVKFIRSKCDEGCDWCIHVTVVTCADTLTSTLCIQ